MKYPALTRALAVVMTVLSLLTLLAGTGALRKAGRDNREQLRQEELLREKTDLAAALGEQLEQGAQGHRAESARLSRWQSRYQKDAGAYRQELATYTATRAGVTLGQEQLNKASAALQTGRSQFDEGYAAFRQGYTAFQQIFSLYQQVRQGFDRGWSAYHRAEEELAGAAASQPDLLTPEQLLAAIAAEREALGSMRELVTQLRENTPADQSGAADAVRQAGDLLARVGPELSGMNVERLAYEAAQELYRRAQAARDEAASGGGSGEEAAAAADAVVREAFGMSFEELGAWLADKEPPPADGTDALPLPELSPEQLEQLAGFLPDDRALLNELLELIGETEADLARQEESLRADPEGMNAPEAALALMKSQLDAGERLMARVEPGLLDGKAQMDALSAQMDAALAALIAGREAITAGGRKLYASWLELEDTLRELQKEKERLERRYQQMDTLEESVAAYEERENEYRSAKAWLMVSGGIGERVRAGEDLIDAARAELLLRQESRSREYTGRRLVAWIMLACAAAGLTAALGAFEKLRLRRLWIPVSAALLLAVAGEAGSLALGRGLWYTALFVGLTALALLPLTLARKSG